MNVLIKDGTGYSKISIADLLQGLEDKKKTDVVAHKIKVHPGIVSIVETARGYKVRVWERNINRTLDVSSIDRVRSTVVDGLSLSTRDKMFIQETLGQLLRTRGLRYKSVKGAIIEMELVNGNGGYRADPSNVLIARTESELGQTNSPRKFIYTNIYDNSSKICFGTTELPVISDFNEIGKVTSSFFTSRINGDLSYLTVNLARWENMVSELRREELDVLEGFETKATKLLELASMLQGTGGTNMRRVSFYLIILIANVCNKDMDWMHDRLYKN